MEWLRRELEVFVEPDMDPVVGLVLKSKNNWNAVSGFVVKVLSTKKEEERVTQRPAEQEAKKPSHVIKTFIVHQRWKLEE